MITLRNIARETLIRLNNNFISKQVFENQITSRSKLRSTSIHKLVEGINIFAPFTDELHRQSNYYGTATILKKYLQIPNKYQFKFAIDHGIVFSENTNQVGTDPSIPTAITFGKYQKNILKAYKPNVYCIGPYIHYAKNLLNEEQIHKDKRKMGPTLLVFPSHSTPSDTVDYDYKGLVKKIRDAGKHFQTIRVCVYWSDIIRGADKVFSEAGFECITAGHVYDPNFLPRLKSIISLSDYAMGNGVGSIVGYCIYMNKPYQIMWQEEKISGHHLAVKVTEDETSSKGFREVISTLSKFSDKITEKQKKVVGYYWGFNQIKIKRELLKIVNSSEDIYKKALKK